MPTCLASRTCSRDCGMMPSSAAMRRMAPSICEAPEIMFLMKSTWPGQSVCAYLRVSVS